MPSTTKGVSIPGSAGPKHSKFREDFDAPFIGSIIDPAAASAVKAEGPASDSSPPTESPKPSSFRPMVLRPSRLSWSSWSSLSSGSRRSSTSAALKRWKQFPAKKLQNGADKLFRSSKGS